MSRDPAGLLEDIIECQEIIESHINGRDLHLFLNSQVVVDAVIRRLEIVGTAVKLLPESLKAEEPTIPWNTIGNFRNILAHAYHQVDEEIVWKAATVDLPVLVSACVRLRDNVRRKDEGCKY